MNKVKLNKREEEIYQRIIKYGTKEDMFKIAYSIGRERVIKEMCEEIFKIK